MRKYIYLHKKGILNDIKVTCRLTSSSDKHWLHCNTLFCISLDGQMMSTHVLILTYTSVHISDLNITQLYEHDRDAHLTLIPPFITRL